MAGVVLQDPGGVVNGLLKKQREDVASQALESGTVQHFSDLDQALDKFQERINDVQQLVANNKEAKQQYEAERAAMKQRRDNLLLHHGEKRYTATTINLDDNNAETDVQECTSRVRCVKPRKDAK